MKRLIIVLAAVMLGSLSVSALAGDDVGVVNMKKVIQQSSQVKNMSSDLHKQFSSEQKKLKKQQDALSADMQKYQKQKTVLSDKKLKALKSKISEQGMKLRQAQAKFQRDLYAAQSASMKKVMKKVRGVIRSVAKDNDVDLVLPENVVLYSKESKDLTSDVIDALN